MRETPRRLGRKDGEGKRRRWIRNGLTNEVNGVNKWNVILISVIKI